jgi:hypothetical protein
MSGYIAKSKSDDWATPKKLYEYLDRRYHFDFDPCPLHSSFDGLNVEWGQRNFINPPYSKLKDFLKKGFEEYQHGKLAVFLIFSKVSDTATFQEYCMRAQEFVFIKGRLYFNDGDMPAPYASMLVIFDPEMKNDKPIVSSLNQDELERTVQTTLGLSEGIKV